MMAPLPRLESSFQLGEGPEEAAPLRRAYLPPILVERIVEWNTAFERARLKAYHYTKFAVQREISMVKSGSRMKLYSRELKTLCMRYHSRGAGTAFRAFVQDHIRCRRPAPRAGDYAALKGIFF